MTRILSGGPHLMNQDAPSKPCACGRGRIYTAKGRGKEYNSKVDGKEVCVECKMDAIYRKALSKDG